MPGPGDMGQRPPFPAAQGVFPGGGGPQMEAMRPQGPRPNVPPYQPGKT